MYTWHGFTVFARFYVKTKGNGRHTRQSNANVSLSTIAARKGTIEERNCAIVAHKLWLRYQCNICWRDVIFRLRFIWTKRKMKRKKTQLKEMERETHRWIQCYLALIHRSPRFVSSRIILTFKLVIAFVLVWFERKLVLLILVWLLFMGSIRRKEKAKNSEEICHGEIGDRMKNRTVRKITKQWN